ncbi:WD40 repeat-like protein, partial [Microthyrium microscopicum]
MALNFVTFNQDNSLLGVGSSKGFKLYTTEPFSVYYGNEEGDVSIMEMLFSTSLVALILSPRLLRILNTKKNTTICELTFPMKILAVRMNRKRLVVVLEDAIYIYDMSNMKLLSTVETSPNPHGLCALSPNSDNNFMAFPQPSKQSVSSYNQPAHAPPTGNFLPPTTGEVLIYDTNKIESVNVIEAHQTTLGSLAINNSGTMLATASEKGTIIRVFSIPSGERLFHFRRGSLPAQIYCMSFNAASTLLAVSSATETIHIFKLVAQQSSSRQAGSSVSPPEPASPTTPDAVSRRRSESFSSGLDRSGSNSDDDMGTPTHDPSPPPRPASNTLASMIRRTSQNVGLSLAARVGGYLPSSVTEMWEPARDFAWVKVPRLARGQLGGPGTSPVKSVVAMSGAHPQLMVVTSEGQFLVYTLSLESGGEGVLEKQYSVLDQKSDMGYPGD